MTQISQLLVTISDLKAELAQAKENLHDRFAMAALTGLIASPRGPESGTLAGTYADYAYDYADAMMSEKKKRQVQQ